MMKNCLKDFETLNSMSKLISLKNTGNPETFAATLNVGLRTMHNYQNVLKSFLKKRGVIIIYNREMQTCQFSREIKFRITEEFFDKNAQNIQ